MSGAALTVVKVGGSLLADGDAVARVCDAIAARRARGGRLLVVASALQGVTDALESAAHDALDSHAGGELVDAVVARLRRRHRDVCRRALDAHAPPPICDAMLRDVDRLLTGVRLTGELTERTRAAILSHGERLSAPILAAGMRVAGADARAVTSEEAGVRARGSHRAASCDVETCRDGMRRLDHELHDRVLVLTGFYALDARGDVVLLGRGGTDYSAGVAAAALGATAFELWKDVPGFMSADPRAVRDAVLLPRISFAEASELGSYGARILHPRCLEPLRGRGVDVSLRSIDDVDAVGTRIVERPTGDGRPVAALAARRGVAVVRVHDPAMVSDDLGVGATVLGALSGEGVTIHAVASAMTTLSVVIADADVPRARKALRLADDGAHRFGEVTLLRDLAMIGVVGDGLSRDAAIVARALTCLADADVAVQLVSHGPGDVSAHLVVADADADRATLALHAALFADTRSAPPSRASRGP